MTTLQQPDKISFCSSMKDFIFSSESAITVQIYLDGAIIVEEEYVPDTSYQVRLWELGRLLSDCLYGSWDGTHKPFGEVRIVVGEDYDYTFTIIQQHMSMRGDGRFLMAGSPVVGPERPASISVWMEEGDTLTVSAEGPGVSSGIVTLAYATERGLHQGIVLSHENLRSLVGAAKFDRCSYLMLRIGKYWRRCAIDHKTRRCNRFRFMNIYDVPEYVYVFGSITQKPSFTDDVARYQGVDRKFSVEASDEYSVDAGTILHLCEYLRWRSFMASRQVEIDCGEWLPVIVSKPNYEVDTLGAISEVKFTFTMAEPSDNILITDYTLNPDKYDTAE